MDGVPDFSPHSSFSLSCRYRNYWDSFSSLRALTAAWAALPRSPPAPSDSLLRVEIGNTQNSLNILNRGSQFRKALDNRNTMHMPGIHLGLSRALFQIGEFTWLPSEQCWREMILQASAAKIRIWKCLQINLVRHVQCLWRKLPWGSNHGLEPRLSHSLKTWEGSQHFQQTAPVMLGKTTSKKKKIKRFIFYRDFLVHSRDLDSFHGPASSQGLSYNNCRAGLWGTAGMLRLSLYVGRTRAVGTCGPSVTETLPLPLHAEMSFTALEPLPARQQQPQLQAAACQLWAEQGPECSKQACLREGVRVSTSIAPLVLPLCAGRGTLPTKPWHFCGMKTKQRSAEWR